MSKASKVKVVDNFPHAVKEIENTWMPMADGTRLAARIWMPEDAESAPVPAILEYIPYRKRDVTAPRDALHHPYFAGHGYASVRVDIRGSGDSEGVLRDEYLEQELQDGEEILRWLAAQPWCNGRVGIIGISWGGFNGLQLAARQPPELGAIITVCSTDDRYADDVHYMGGCLLGDNLSWASTMFAYNSQPPDPQIVGDNWRKMWRQRLEESGLWLANWLEHQHRDGFWKHGSICEDYTAVKTPVMAVSGWADGYSNAVFRLLKYLTHVPRQGLVGPWSHTYPHIGQPGPAIGFLQECVRWWDRWLKDDESNGIMDEPMLRAFLQDHSPPETAYTERPGRWIGERHWPSNTIDHQLFPIAPNDLLEPGAPSPGGVQRLSSPLTVGLFAGKWCSYAAGPDLAGDQREEDGGALVFESEMLDEDMQILGKPWVHLRFRSDEPVAMVAMRLSDVNGHGEATRVTYGVHNLTHRDSHEHPEPLEVGTWYDVKLKMNDIAQIFRKGNRIRLSLSTVYWPLAWPAPKPVRLEIDTGESFLELPIRRPAEDEADVAFEPPEAGPPLRIDRLKEGQSTWRVIRDLASGVSTLEVIKDDGTWYLPDANVKQHQETWEWYSSCRNDHESIRGRTYRRKGFKRDDWRVETQTHCTLSCDVDNFYVVAELDAWEGEARVFSRNWNFTIPRRLV